MALKFNKEYLIKGFLLAIILMIGTIVGVFLRYLEFNGYVIFAFVGLIDVFATIFVFKFLEKEFFIKELKKDEDNKESKMKSNSKTKSDE